jgi:hypothetical protein
MGRLIILVLLLAFGSLGNSQSVTPNRPDWTVALKKYGWRAPEAESNKSFFSDYSLTKLEALDDNTRVKFVTDDLIVVYHTKQQGQEWKTASRQLEAFFISANDGKLLSVKSWPTVVRGDESDLIDSESRLIPLSKGRFLVVASKTMMLYGDNLGLINQKKFDPLTSGNLWSAQSVANGEVVFLRHQSTADQQTRYYWLASDTLLPRSQMSGPRGANFSVVATAGDNFVLTTLGFAGLGMTTGIGKVSVDGSTMIICSEQFCREGGVAALAMRSVVISGRRGIGVVDIVQGLQWSKQISPSSNPNTFQFGDVRPAMSANEFAVWVTATRKTLFDGVQVGNKPTLFVYDTSGKILFTVPVARKSGDFDFALSPNGNRLAVFDGAGINLYTIPRS